MNGHLVPEQRVNKLGHVVTKHVNPDKSGGATRASASIPSPAIVDPEREHQKLRAEVVNSLKDKLTNPSWDRFDKEIEAKLRDFPLAKVQELLSTARLMDALDKEMPRFARASLGAAITNATGADLDDFCKYGPLIKGKVRMVEVPLLIRKLRKLANEGTEFLENFEPHMSAAARHKEIADASDLYWNNDELVRFVNNHPEKAEVSVEFWNRNPGNLTEESLASYLKHGVVRDGWL